MPSSPGYKRNYQAEYANETATRRKQRSMRNAARAAYEQASGSQVPAGMDVDHKQPLSKGGTNDPANLGLQEASSNRSYPRTRKGAMKPKRD